MDADIARAAQAATIALGGEEQRRDPLAWWCLTELLYSAPWKRCPSTHCERRGECSSPSDCIVKTPNRRSRK